MATANLKRRVSNETVETTYTGHAASARGHRADRAGRSHSVDWHATKQHNTAAKGRWLVTQSPAFIPKVLHSLLPGNPIHLGWSVCKVSESQKSRCVMTLLKHGDASLKLVSMPGCGLARTCTHRRLDTTALVPCPFPKPLLKASSTIPLPAADCPGHSLTYIQRGAGLSSQHLQWGRITFVCRASRHSRLFTTGCPGS